MGCGRSTHSGDRFDRDSSSLTSYASSRRRASSSTMAPPMPIICAGFSPTIDSLKPRLKTAGEGRIDPNLDSDCGLARQGLLQVDFGGIRKTRTDDGHRRRHCARRGSPP